MPKKVRNLHYELCSPRTIVRAQYEAQKGKGRRKEILRFNEYIIENLDAVWEMLEYNTYVPSPYREKIIYEPKRRIIKIAPFFPDRIIHKCIMNVFGPIWKSQFIDSTYACIKKRGISKCLRDLHLALQDYCNTRYCLKLDVRKFYDSVDHDILKRIIRETIDDERSLVIVDRIIDSAPGLPIGNETSQTMANLYLTGLDRYIKRVLKVRYYFRYMDDMVFLSATKEKLWMVLDGVKNFLQNNLNLHLKKEANPFPVDSESIDFVGYKSNHYNILLRKKILYNFYKKMQSVRDKYGITGEDTIKHELSSYWGFLLPCTEEHRKNILKMAINGKID